MVRFSKYRRIYFTFTGLLVIGSIVCLVLFGLKPGIDFTGGSVLEVEYVKERPTIPEIENALKEAGIKTFYVQEVGEKGALIKMKDISEQTRQKVLQKLGEKREVKQLRFEAIGPTIGRELKKKTKIVILLALLSIVIYVALAFRRIQKPIHSWGYGIASCIALFHDILIPLGIFSILGRFYNIEITIPVITALLTVLGYSVNNTVVVFDRVRENLLKKGGYFDEVIDLSINETLTRQINTSLTTLFVSFAIFFFGGESLKYFALALILGISAGTYSSIFLAGPLLVFWYKRKLKKIQQ